MPLVRIIVATVLGTGALLITEVRWYWQLMIPVLIFFCMLLTADEATIRMSMAIRQAASLRSRRRTDLD